MKSLFFILVSFSIVISCQAKTLYVDDDAPGGDGAFKYDLISNIIN